MSYVPGYQHDVFVSYAHIDNEPLIPTEKGWVTTFAGHLKNVLDRGLGSRDSVIWMDRGLTGHEPFPEQIEAALRTSAILLVVASPSYLKSAWCERELLAFIRDKSASGARIFRVDLEAPDQQQFPPVFRDLLGYPFWATDTNGNPHTYGLPIVDPLREPEYFTILNKFRIELGEELKRMRTSRSGDGGAHPPAPTIFLAEVTDDLDDRREELDAYVKQAGMTVGPQTWYPREELATYQQRMAADLKQSRLFVQLLSEIPGKKPPGWPSRPAVVQFQQAKAAGIPILQWRSREMDIEKLRVASADHFDLVTGPEVRACGIEEFKRAVIEEAARATRSKDRNGERKEARQNIVVFVNADSEDRPLADWVCQCLKKEGFGYSMPLLAEGIKPADVRKDLEDSLRECDGLVLVYGNTPVTWVRRQLAQGRKILSQRPDPLEALALALCPPEEKQAVGIELPNMQLLDVRGGLRCEVLTAWASALGSGR